MKSEDPLERLIRERTEKKWEGKVQYGEKTSEEQTENDNDTKSMIIGGAVLFIIYLIVAIPTIGFQWTVSLSLVILMIIFAKPLLDVMTGLILIVVLLTIGLIAAAIIKFAIFGA